MQKWRAVAKMRSAVVQEAEVATRTVDVPGHGTFEVPEHVSRVDSFKLRRGGQAASGWHGWQVRWPGFNKFFSDSQHGGCEAALLASSCYAEQHYPGKRSQCDPAAGVRLVERKKASRQVVEIYIEVSHPMRGKAARRLYVGTTATVTPGRIRKKKAEGKRLRRELVREHKLITGRQ